MSGGDEHCPEFASNRLKRISTIATRGDRNKLFVRFRAERMSYDPSYVARKSASSAFDFESSREQ